MAKRSFSKKYKIISGFYYRGQDGKSKNAIRMGPGEAVPKLDSDELNRLIALEKIAEISSETGEIIVTKKAIILTNEEIDKFLNKNVPTIVSVLKNNNFSTETLSKILIEAEKRKMNKALIDIIENSVNERMAV